MGSSFKSPVDTAKAISAAAGIKNSANAINLILLAFLAGAYIGFGGLLAEVASAGIKDIVGFGLYKFIFGAVFPVGLIIVILAGSELFTGNILYMVVGVLNKSASIRGLTKSWVLCWIFNFVGALFVAYVLAYLAGVATVDPVSSNAISVAQAKVAMGWDQAFFKAIGCNWLVCLAVWLANASDDIIGKIFGIWFPVMAFVAIGFEHSIANMFFIPLGIFLGAEGVTWANMFTANLIPVTLGNIVGAAIFVACIYWYTYLRD